MWEGAGEESSKRDLGPGLRYQGDGKVRNFHLVERDKSL